MQFTTLAISTFFLSGAWAVAAPQAATTTAGAGAGGSAATTSTPTGSATIPSDLPNSSQLSSILSVEESDIGKILSMIPSSYSTLPGYEQITALLGSAATDTAAIPTLVASLEQDPASLSEVAAFYTTFTEVMATLSSLSSLGGAAPAPTGAVAAKAGGIAAAGMAALVLL